MPVAEEQTQESTAKKVAQGGLGYATDFAKKQALKQLAKKATFAAGPEVGIAVEVADRLKLWKLIKWVAIGIGCLIFLFFFMILNKSSGILLSNSINGTQAGLPQPTPSGGGGPYVSADIAICQFTRSDQTPSAAKFSSPLLLSYIEQAAKTSTVPAVVLAAFTRVESPSSVTYSDQDILSYASNIHPVSGTGALGLVQIQPPRQIHNQVRLTYRLDSNGNPTIPDFDSVGAYDSVAVGNGASLIGKTSDQLTLADFFDPLSNLTMAAGFILGKLQEGGYGNGKNWNPSWTTDAQIMDYIGFRYYGSHTYGNADQYSYGGDLYTSVQSCQQSLATAPSPSPIINPPTSSSDIVGWASNIDNQLFHGSHQDTGSYDWNAMTATISNGSYQAQTRQGNCASTDQGCDDISPNGTYFCTNLIIDAYNLAGISGLGPGHQAVRTMLPFWQTNSSAGYLYYSTPSTQSQSYWSNIKPGYVVFYSDNNGPNHVNLIADKSINSNGDGQITTYDANSSHKSYVFPIHNWNIQNIFAPQFSITGIGGHQ